MNESNKKSTIYITCGFSLWERPCYWNVLKYDSINKCQKLTTI